MTTIPQSEFGDFDWVISKVELCLRFWKTIAIGTLVLTTAATAFFVLSSNTLYSSKMVLPLPPAVRALIQSGSVAPGVTVSAELTPGSGLFSLTTLEQSPEAAKATLTAALNQILLASKPSGTARDRILQQIEILERSIAGFDAFKTTIATNVDQTKPDVSASQVFAGVLSGIAEREGKIWDLKTQLMGIRQEDVLLPPSAPMSTSPTKLGRNIFIAFIVSLCVMALFVTMRDAVQRRRMKSV